MRTPLITASLLMTVLMAAVSAPGASALQCSSQYIQCSIPECQSTDPVIDEVCEEGGGVGLPPLPNLDEDEDGIPDDIEFLFCGFDDVAALLELTGQVSCPAPDDVETNLPVAELVGIVTGIVNDGIRIGTTAVGAAVNLTIDLVELVRNAVDPDHDNVPEVAEPAICRFNNDGTDLDGSCDDEDEDFTPPSI